MEQRFSAFADALTSDIDTCLGGPLTEERRFALLRLKARFRKKFRLSADGLAEKCLADFISLNERVKLVKPSLDQGILSNASLFIREAFEKYSRSLDPDLIQVPFVRSRLLDFWRFGPGASHGLKVTHTVEKMHEPMTCTPLAEPLVKSLRLQHPYIRSFDAKEGKPTVVVCGSKMSTVPKNQDTERTIAIEPSGNMALQLAVGFYFEEVLRGIGLDIRHQQEKNKVLAYRGSLNGRLCTLDLSSASDLITPALCKQLLPPEVYRFLMRIRSPQTVINGKVFDLNMISTMGNGFTFPLMTLIILSLMYACLLECGGPVKFINYSFISVFGDDIVIPSHIHARAVEVLTQAGFIVNNDKSYHTGHFRESCGGDYYKGYDVTPFYVKSLSKVTDIYVALNQVLRYCGEHNFVFDATLRTLRSFINGPVLRVPEWHSDTAGVRTTLVAHRYRYLREEHRYKALLNEHFLTSLSAGGYIVSRPSARGTTAFYIPRPRQPRYVSRKTRLPRGYLDGRCSVSYSGRVSSFIDSWLFLLE